MNLEAVKCGNVLCPTYLKFGERRHIGDRTSGAGGRWPCKACGQWTVIEEPASVTA